MKYEKKIRKSRVGERGQVTIPKSLRTQYGVKPGQEVVFEAHEDGLLIRKAPRHDPLRALFGRVQREMDVDRYLEQTRGSRWSPELDGE